MQPRVLIAVVFLSAIVLIAIGVLLVPGRMLGPRTDVPGEDGDEKAAPVAPPAVSRPGSRIVVRSARSSLPAETEPAEDWEDPSGTLRPDPRSVMPPAPGAPPQNGEAAKEPSVAHQPAPRFIVPPARRSLPETGPSMASRTGAGVVMLPVSSALPETGQTVCYDTWGQEIDCSSSAWPGQDGAWQAGGGLESRFLDLGDGTVADRRTGLMWQKEAAVVVVHGRISAAGDAGWQDALRYCNELELGGHTDWRLPNVRELQSIVDYGRSAPCIDPVFEAVPSWYWSSTTVAAHPGSAWYVHFNDGYLGCGNKAAFHQVRAVRG